MVPEQSVWLAFALTTIAGLSTGIGSLIALLAKRTNSKFLCASLGFSAGVMLYVSFMDLLPMAKEEFVQIFGIQRGTLFLLLAFFGGIGLITLIDFVIPKINNPHEFQGVEEIKRQNHNKKSLHRTGMFVAFALVVHNFPEGIAIFSSALSNGLSVAIPITLAIAIHNIPEGIAVSVPIYHATGNKRKAFWISFLSGLTEPVGAVVAYLFLIPFWTPAINGIVIAAVAGIMVYIALDELLPAAEKYGEHHISISGLIAGMILMALSLYLFI
jgi:ZIP family zinc transporter